MCVANIFLPLYDLSFYSLNNIFWKVKNIDEVPFLIDDTSYVFGVVFKESNPRLQKFSSGSFTDLGCSGYLFLFKWALAVCAFQGIHSFYLYCWIIWHEDVYTFPIFLVIFVAPIMVFHLSYLLLVVFVCFGFWWSDCLNFFFNLLIFLKERVLILSIFFLFCTCNFCSFVCRYLSFTGYLSLCCYCGWGRLVQSSHELSKVWILLLLWLSPVCHLIQSPLALLHV